MQSAQGLSETLPLLQAFIQACTHSASHQGHQEDGPELAVPEETIFQELLGFIRGAIHKHQFFWKATQLAAFLRI